MSNLPGAVPRPGGPQRIPYHGAPAMPQTFIIPPGGFAGFAQQTPAAQAMFQRAARTPSARGARRRKRKTAKAAAPRKRRRALRAKKGRLVKGSRAAKAYMAKIRRRRKR